MLKIIFITIFLVAGCGQKSEVKTHIEAKRLGDGKHIVHSIVLPISDESLAYQSPLKGSLPFIGGLTRFLGDVLVATTKLGNMHVSYVHPIPEISDNLHSIRVTRFLLYMKPLSEKQKRFRDFVTELVFGKRSVTFDFLNKFAIRMVSQNLDLPENYIPELVTKEYHEKNVSRLLEAFSQGYNPDGIDPEEANEIVLLKYDVQKRNTDLVNKQFGHIHILETSSDPNKLRKYLVDHPKLQDVFKRVTLLNNSLLVELVKDPVASEIFLHVLNSEDQTLKTKYGYKDIDTCNETYCIELAVPKVNLVPILSKGNAIEMEGIIKPGTIPESFKLKGFVEFEIKLKSEI